MILITILFNLSRIFYQRIPLCVCAVAMIILRSFPGESHRCFPDNYFLLVNIEYLNQRQKNVIIGEEIFMIV